MDSAQHLGLARLLSEVGFAQGRNDPRLFTRGGIQLVIWVDDILVRGNLDVTIEFYNQLGARIDCKDPESLEPGGGVCFTGIDITREVVGGEDWYYLSHISEIQEMIGSAELTAVKLRESPMPDRNECTRIEQKLVTTLNPGAEP